MKCMDCYLMRECGGPVGIIDEHNAKGIGRWGNLFEASDVVRRGNGRASDMPSRADRNRLRRSVRNDQCPWLFGRREGRIRAEVMRRTTDPSAAPSERRGGS